MQGLALLNYLCKCRKDRLVYRTFFITPFRYGHPFLRWTTVVSLMPVIMPFEIAQLDTDLGDLFY